MKDLIQFRGGIRKTHICFVLLIISLMLFTTHALAQDGSNGNDPGDEFTLEEITVTGSRIRQTGMDTPTPVTVVVPDEIEMTSPNTVIEGLAELPQFFGSSTTQNVGSQAVGGFFQSTGAGTLNLRGLQSKRTLQLLNGRRVVPSTIFGGPDINMFPELLLRSVETVTGGASAAYGTDAVAGVVNFILNTDYEGIKGHIQMGETEKGHNKNEEYEIAGGFALGDRTRVLFSAEKGEQDGIFGDKLHEYEWYDSYALMKNPDPDAGNAKNNPYYIPVAKVYGITASPDGIFYSPSGSPVYTFNDAGNAVPYVLGSGICNSHGCGTPNANGSPVDTTVYNTTITPDSSRENFFGYIEHDLSQKLKVYAQAMYGKSSWRRTNYGGAFPNPPFGFLDRNFTIYSGNPYLPSEIQQLMDDNGWASIPFSRIGSPSDLASNAFTEQKTSTLSLTTGFEYTVGSGFFDDWQVKGYLQYGETEVKAIQHGGIRLDRIYLAADAVRDDQGNIVCNVTNTSGLYQDCVPINLFGAGNASAEAIDWVSGFEPGVPMNVEGFLSATESMPYSYTSGENKQRIINIDQTVFELSADGELYEGWGAGPISMAVGYGYREASFDQVVEVGPGGNVNADPTYRPVMANDPALGIRGVPGGNAASGNSVEIQFSNVPFARGSQSVHEAFDELLVPLLSDLPFMKQLNFNGAARWAKYSGSGTQWSYKGGLDWAVNNELRFRSTLSRDVRAATIGEKFDRTGGIGNVTDWGMDSTGGTSYSITTFSNGSPDIQPERATTGTVGLIYMPEWLSGLSFSMDWYSVEVKDNIQQLDQSEVSRQCYVDGIEDMCALITRGGVEDVDENGDPINRISLVGKPYINQDSVKAAGVDFELGYRSVVEWFGGPESISFRLLGSYVGENSSTQGDSKTENAGISFPEWVATVSFTYRRGPLGLSLQNRYTDKTLISRDYNYNGTSERWDVYDNEIESEIITDAQVNYRFDLDNGNLSLFLNVNNVFDKAPQYALTGEFTDWFGYGTGTGVRGDLRGRRYVVGMKFEFK